MEEAPFSIVIGGRRGPRLSSSKPIAKRVLRSKPIRVKLHCIDGKTQLSEGYSGTGSMGGLGTGGVLWDSGLFLARWIHAQRGALFAADGQRVLELGSGLGLPGIVAAACVPSPARVVLTDCVDEVLTALAVNARANAAAPAAAGDGARAPPRVDVLALDWRALDDGARRIVDAAGSTGDGDATFDVVLCAPLVYMVEMAPLLADVIATFLAARGVVLAIFPANRHGVDEFLADMDARGFACDRGGIPAACVGPAMSVRWCPGKHRCCVLYRRDAEGAAARWGGLLAAA